MIALLAAALLGGNAPRSLLAELEGLDRKLTAAEERLLTLDRQEAALRVELAATETQIAVTKLRRDESFAAYRRRLVALARMPAGARLVLLGGSRSLADYLEGARVLRWVAEHDKKLHRAHAQEVARLAALESRLAERRLELESQVALARVNRDELAATHGERLELLKRINEQADLRALLAGEQSSARQALASTILRLEPVGTTKRRFSANRGRLPWPAAGRVEVRFGQRVETAYGTITSHNGVDLRAQSGSPVQAIAAGRVAYTGWLKGYGQIVIVDHGEHYHSLVAHLARIDVEAGDELEQGRVLGTVGDTGSLRGPLLYFELRERGAPVDPLGWLRR